MCILSDNYYLPLLYIIYIGSVSHAFKIRESHNDLSFMALNRKIAILLMVFAVIIAATMLLERNLLWQFHQPLLQAEQSSSSQQVTRKDVDDSSPQHTIHPLLLLSGPISKDMIVHSVYFDDRARDGHRNVSMFLVGANRTIFDNNWIVGCGIGNKDALEFKARFTAEDYLMHPHRGSERPFPYEEFIVECYDLPVVNGSQAFIMYKTAHNSPVYVVVSEKPLFIPAPRIPPSGEHNFTVVTCTKVHNKNVTWLPEFVRYQKTIGVDHVHMNILDTFIKDGGLKAHLTDPNLAQAVLEGFVSFSVWEEWYSPYKKEIYVHSEILRKLDCIYRFRGTYDYAFSLDTDDFFNPRIPEKTNLKDYILTWCYGDFIGSCIFKWVYYYPGECGLNDERIDDGNVTRALRSYVRGKAGFKSLHMTSALLDASFHDATCRLAPHACLMPGYKVVKVPLNIAYVAHLRMNAKPPSKCS